MLAVLPLDVSVSELFKRPGIKASGPRQLALPFDDWHMNPIRSGIANDKANLRGRSADSPQTGTISSEMGASSGMAKTSSRFTELGGTCWEQARTRCRLTVS